MRKYFQIGFICFSPIDLELVTGFIQMANSQEMISSTELMLELDKCKQNHVKVLLPTVTSSEKCESIKHYC